MQGLNFTIFDFETTGLDPEKDRVIEMAAVRVCDGHIVSEFSTLVKNGPVIPKITEITGITNEELEHGMPERTAFQILNRYLGDSILVAHNAAFDLAFLHHSLMRNADRTFDNSFYDTLTISRDRHYYPHKLTDMCDRYGIKLEGAHRALNDVYGCWDLLKKMHEEEPVDKWMNKLGYMSKYGAPKWTPEYAVIFPTENKYEPRSV
ncbi:DNA polymerase-3 subunit epsilon [Paenibacillus sp. V4I3]|uniref:3'-5' exonuclease n=1 Tax=Paenibacillus sp. V4I3 TaxID=3042305 RepID=UPI00277FFE26|nr:3'-5' exonuclease [Paenibacillus sp. V4I3]MDQ0873764.1 DNA polymerase-3 subunit epsilon [Paenibacillus sp. V4I3]